jgi:predicted HicB family RNase H-like nuclease
LKIEKEEYINKTFRLDIKLVREMEKICAQKRISLNKLVAICMRYALDNLDTDEDDD